MREPKWAQWWACSMLHVASLPSRQRAAIVDEATLSESAELERQLIDADKALDAARARLMAFWPRVDVAANREREVLTVRAFLDGPADGRSTVSAVEPATMFGDPVPDEILVREMVVPCMVRFVISEYDVTVVPDFECFASLNSRITLEYFFAAALTEQSKRIVAFSGHLTMRATDDECRQFKDKNNSNPRMEVHYGDCRLYGYTRKPSVPHKLWSRGINARMEM